MRAESIANAAPGTGISGVLPNLRVAIVHDWLYTVGGAERVLAAMLRVLPQADVFCLFDLLPPEGRAAIGLRGSTTSFLQRMPMLRRRHRLYLPLMPIAVEQFDLSGYDLVISSSYAVAKGVLTGPVQLHIAYVHSPMRYAWDLQHQYLRETNITGGIKGALARALLHRMRIWDSRTAHGPDVYLANSAFVAWRIRKIYGREAEVIHPPVRVQAVFQAAAKERFFLTASRLVPYKNVHQIVAAFRRLPDERLLVAGDGPERARLEALAGPNVTFLGHVPDAELRRLMAAARAFIFAAEEDFGIVPIEAQAQGTPVVALGRGGLCETIVTTGPQPTGMFFDRADPQSIAATLDLFMQIEPLFLPEACHANALRFAEARFEAAFGASVQRHYEEFRARVDGARARPLPLGAAEREAARETVSGLV